MPTQADAGANSESVPSVSRERNPIEAAYRVVFDAFDDDRSETLSRRELVTHLTEVGILEDDPRIQGILAATADGDSGENTREMNFREFISLIKEHSGLIQRAMQGQLAVPDFAGLVGDVHRMYREILPVRSGAVADYIPQLARVNPEQFAISLCTVDGQRTSVGDDDVPFCVQSVSKTVSYCLALEEHGVDLTHGHVGREPSGQSFNELTLNRQGRPHNPMINAGAIMCCSLIRPELAPADRFDHVARTWQRLAGGRRTGFNNAVYLSERQTADRNFALGYSMRENRAFPNGTNLQETLEFYFQCCSVELDARMLSVVAGTLAAGGVCPLTGDRVFSEETVQHCLSLMATCGMYDFSGEFAFTVGLPAKSGVSGAMMIVIPQLMGICVWSPRLDELGNSVRGIEFCRKLVAEYQVHPHAAMESQTTRKDPRKRRNQSSVESVVALCWAASQGDLDEVRRLSAAGTDLGAADYDGRTALHLAASEGRIDVVRYLLARGVPPAPADRWGGTPLHDAEREGHGETATLLREAGADASPAPGGQPSPDASTDSARAVPGTPPRPRSGKSGKSGLSGSSSGQTGSGR
ncbi:glutaminase A [Streptomyces sp. YC504]|uniref:Glutaminase n=1 Tax=Streptomyces mesophilus TaxID=1775132 RepID=A0A6G4XYE0_9ACTN|nr:glutaminase A [Streptomyces mesophilus]NGO81780.1 glutaminase A [Streptomyces mesophilus]